jgi:hypothetical protein
MKAKPRPAVVPEGMRFCSRGEGHLAPIADFGRNVREKDGLNAACKACARAYARAYHHAHYSPKPPRPKRVAPATYVQRDPDAPIYRPSRRSARRFVSCCLCEKPGAPHDGFILCPEHIARLGVVVSGQTPRLTRTASLVPKKRAGRVCTRDGCGLPIPRASRNGLCARHQNSVNAAKRMRRIAAEKKAARLAELRRRFERAA